MDIRLDGKAALNTAGSQGLDKDMALKLANAGSDIAIMARRKDVLNRAAAIDAVGSGKVHAMACDLMDAGATRAAFAEAAPAPGKIDVVVNNAGASRAGPFSDISDEDWQNDFELKLFAAIRLCRLALPGMTAHPWGRIINVLNIGANAPRKMFW